MKVYKVVTPIRTGDERDLVMNHFDKLRSCVIESAEVAVIYEPDKWVEAHPFLADRGHHLTTFDTLHNAWVFASKYWAKVGSELWEAEGEDEVKLPTFLKWFSAKYWKECVRLNVELSFHKAVGMDISLHWPPGTRMFKRLKLIKKVEWKEAENA